MWLLWLVIVGLIAGWAAGKIMGTGGYGPVMDILLGIGRSYRWRLSASPGGSVLVGRTDLGDHCCHYWSGILDLAEPQAEESLVGPSRNFAESEGKLRH